MESLKQYAPWIIGAIILIYVLRKATTRTALLPQTVISETPQVDPFAETRAKAFDVLASLGIAQTQADLESKRIDVAADLESKRIASGETINLSSLDVSRYIANLNFMQRDQDRQVQQSAIDNYYSSRNTGNILSSINQGLSTIFGRQQSGNVFGTPPTFPRFGGFF
jgi:hypothetical protein